jgi:hypothetical protein
MFPAGLLPKDVSLLIMSKTAGPFHRLARFFRVSSVWRNTLATYVARETSTATFYRRLAARLSDHSGCGMVDLSYLDEAKIREQLQAEDLGRFASLCLLLERNVVSKFKARFDTFGQYFVKRGVLRILVASLRNRTRIVKLDLERPSAVRSVDEARFTLQRREKRVLTIDTTRVELEEKKRKLDGQLGM